jgi:hypothetical protein
MSVGDTEQSLSRGGKAMQMVYGEGGLIEQLQKSFTLRVFGFDRTTRPLVNPADLSFTGGKTDTAGAMQHAVEAMQGLPLEALVVVTDGIDNSSTDPLQMASIISAGQTPVHLIGIGTDAAAKDIEISQVSTSGSIMEGGIFAVQVTVWSRGYAGQEAELLIEVGENIVAAKKITLGPDSMVQRHTLYLTPITQGSVIYTARIPEQKGEILEENNRLPFLVETPEKEVEILYIEGHPRNEYKFIRRAAETDTAVRLKNILDDRPAKIPASGHRFGRGTGKRLSGR